MRMPTRYLLVRLEQDLTDDDIVQTYQRVEQCEGVERVVEAAFDQAGERERIDFMTKGARLPYWRQPPRLTLR